jgi:putative SOS response-associated peptidase YedK
MWANACSETADKSRVFGDALARRHCLVPVVYESVWLGEFDGDHATLLRPAPDGLLRIWPVDRRVGSPHNNGPELLASIVR